MSGSSSTTRMVAINGPFGGSQRQTEVRPATRANHAEAYVAADSIDDADRLAADAVRIAREQLGPNHLLLGTDRPLAKGAATQWQQYLAGRDGLASNGPDYMWRPSPVVTSPPEDDMFSDDDRKTLNAIRKEQQRRADLDRKRNQNLRELIKRKYKATDADLDAIFAEVEKD